MYSGSLGGNRRQRKLTLQGPERRATGEATGLRVRVSVRTVGRARDRSVGDPNCYRNIWFTTATHGRTDSRGTRGPAPTRSARPAGRIGRPTTVQRGTNTHRRVERPAPSWPLSGRAAGPRLIVGPGWTARTTDRCAPARALARRAGPHARPTPTRLSTRTTELGSERLSRHSSVLAAGGLGRESAAYPRQPNTHSGRDGRRERSWPNLGTPINQCALYRTDRSSTGVRGARPERRVATARRLRVRKRANGVLGTFESARRRSRVGLTVSAACRRQGPGRPAWMA